MSAPPLRSDQVNYLIWRSPDSSTILGLTAWVFESRAKSLTLHLFYKGIYRNLHANRGQPFLYFGPEPAANDAPPPPSKPANEEDSSSPSRKPGREGLINGLNHDTAIHAPGAKRTRRTNGAVNGNGRPKSGESMDADHHGSSHHGEPATKRDPTTNNSPAAAAVAATAANAPTGMEMDLDVGAKVDRGMEMEVDDGQGVGVASADAADEAEDDDAGGMGASHLQVQAQVIPTLSNGQSVGVQSDKVTDLGPETAVLDLPSENVTHVCWNPRDPTLLATGGDALCRIWSISTSFLAHARSGPDSAAVGPEANRDINSALTPDQNIDLLEVPEAIVTAMAWSPDGDSIAVAMHPESSSARGTIVIKSKTGEHLDYLPGGQDWVLDLHWNPSGSLLLGVTHSDDTNSVLMVWDIRTGRVIEPFHFDHNIIDVAWVDNRTLALCGPSFIASTAVNDHNLEAIQQFADSNYSHDWSFIRHDDIRHSIAIVSEHSGFLALLEEDPFDSIIHTISYIEAHDSGITDLMYQPVSNPAALDRNAPRMLATAGNDGKVKLWDARRPMGLVRTLDMGGASPALALSFTCDGYLVAAASYNKVLFWNAETGGLPKATWTARNIAWPSQSAEHAHQSNGNGNGNHENEDTNMSDGLWTYSLSWDADGHKLAFGAKDKVAIISFRR